MFCGDPGIPLYGPSGSSAHLRGVVRGLRSLGHDVTVAAVHEVDARGRFGEPLDVPVVTAPPRAWPRGMRSFGAARDRRRLGRRAGRARGIGLVWERASAGCSEGLRLARRIGVPHWLELNAPLALEQGRDPGGTDVLAGTDRVLAVSPWLVRYAERHGAADVRLLPNGSALAPVPREEARTRLGWDGLVLIHHGSLKPWHGLSEVLPVLDALPEARLVVVGEGEVPTHPRLSRFPHADTGRLSELLSAADVAVVPFPDGAPPWLDPLKIWDCLAVGLPVVGSTHPAARSADLQIPLGDVEGWRRALLALGARERLPRPRSWTAVCREAVRGITAG